MDREGSASQRIDVACVGEALWDLRAPRGTPLETAAHVTMEPGGGAVNVALGLTRLGVRAGIVAAMGEDPVGRALVGRLASLGIDVTHVHASRTRTGLVFLTSTPPRAVAYRAPREEALALGAALPRAFDAAIVHVSGILPSRRGLASLVRAARRARREGALVTVDANLRPRLWTSEVRARVDPRELFAEADVLKVSEDDLRVLGAAETRDPSVLVRPDAIVVSTHGPRPAHARGPFGEVSAGGSALEIESAIGAGDAFVAGFLSLLAREKGASVRSRETIERALRRGNEVARDTLRERMRLK
jgi:sugar/nucleoside kinase (ribokinase family)